MYIAVNKLKKEASYSVWKGTFMSLNYAASFGNALTITLTVEPKRVQTN